MQRGINVRLEEKEMSTDEQMQNITQLLISHEDLYEELHDRLYGMKATLVSLEEKFNLNLNQQQLFEKYILSKDVMYFLEAEHINTNLLKKMICYFHDNMAKIFENFNLANSRLKQENQTLNQLMHTREISRIDRILKNLDTKKTELAGSLNTNLTHRQRSLYLSIIHAASEIEKLHNNNGNKLFLSKVASCLLRVTEKAGKVEWPQIEQLQSFMNQIAVKHVKYKRLAAALIVIIGILAIAGVPFTFGISGIIGGSIVTASGCGLFYKTRSHGLHKALSEVSSRISKINS